MFGAVIIVAVAPEQELFEDEEQRDAGDQRDAHLVHVFHARASTACGMRQQRRA